jgi:hypothetical protein
MSETSWNAQLETAEWPIWEFGEDGFFPPENDAWRDSLPWVRVAYTIMGHSKEQMLGLWRENADETATIMEEIAREARNIESVLQLLRSASARLILSGSAAHEVGALDVQLQ